MVDTHTDDSDLRLRALRPGITAVLRVKNEAGWLPYSLPPLLRAFDAVILVDNGSTDATAELSRELAAGMGAEGRLCVLDYPLPLSRCGPEHLATPPSSPHSLAYFNNWAVSHVQTPYAVKWDGDMVLSPAGEQLLEQFGWQVGRREVLLRVPRHSLYVEDDRVAYLDVGVTNAEQFGHPVLPGYDYVKAFEWETLRAPAGASQLRFPAGICAELKHLSEDEFDHWTDTSAFEASARQARKRREMAVFRAAASGQLAQLPGVVRIESPLGVPVIDHVVQSRLPALVNAPRQVDPTP